MYRRFTVAAFAACSLVAIASVQAAPVSYRFTVEVTEGTLAGNTFEGMFSFDDDAVSGDGEEVLQVEDGLSVNMTMLGETIHESQDVDYPEYPQLILIDGTVERLEFWAESEERGSWWNLPGWDITVERLEEN